MNNKDAITFLYKLTFTGALSEHHSEVIQVIKLLEQPSPISIHTQVILGRVDRVLYKLLLNSALLTSVIVLTFFITK